MPDPLLLTKISLPMLRHILVPRKKVLRELSEGIEDGHLLTLVSAPAGYGKTTSIRMWVGEAGYPVAWVTLEHSDNDLKQFLIYLLTALQRIEETLGQAALEVVENIQEINLQNVIGLLINDLCELDHPILLVLEEYHLIENERIDQAIELILNQAVANLHLVIVTREDPNLPLTRLRVRNQLTEIRAADLSFSVEEAGEFFSIVMGVNLAQKEMEILQNRTEGWVAGLQLAALSLKESRRPTQLVEEFRGTHRHVLDYLIEEVLNSQPADVRAFLQQTSILDQLSPSLCETVTGQVSSEKYLHELEHNNLFLISLDEERTWYRYHALFAELLRNQLLQAEPDRVDDLHERAAGWYQNHGYIQQAIEHAFQIPDGNTLSKLIERYALPMIYQGEVSAVRRWFDRLPEPLMQASPMTCISRAWSLALMQRRASPVEEIQQALQAADDALDRTNADGALRSLVAGHAASIQAFSMGPRPLTHENAEELIELAQKAQRLLPEDEKAIHSVNALTMGNGYMALASLPEAERVFKQTLEFGMAGGNYYAAVYGPINLILIVMIQGQLNYAMQLCDLNIDRFNRLAAGRKFPPIGALHILKGCLFLEENRLAEADDALTQGLSLIRWTGEYRTHMKGYAALARLRSMQGNRVGMLESIKSLEETRPESALYARALRHHLSLRGPTAHKTGLEDAHHWAAQEIAEFKNLPDITGVDPLSDIHFRTCLSAAHVLTRLTARDPRAYSLPDVDKYLARQEKFAEAHGLFGWLVEIWIIRALMSFVQGKVENAHSAIQNALSASVPRGYFRIFLDEADLMRPLLESVRSRLVGSDLAGFVKRLLEALPGESAKSKTTPMHEEILSDRELDVLRLLAAGESYKEVGQKLFLSLNTVQFHVKSIYRKLLVNKRVQAIDKAREMKLI